MSLSNSARARTDREIMTEVFDRLREDWRSSIDGLGIGVKDGVVELKGVSRWPEDRDRAIEIVREVEGVREVISEIQVIER